MCESCSRSLRQRIAHIIRLGPLPDETVYIKRCTRVERWRQKSYSHIFGKRGPSLAANIPYGLISQWHRLARSIWISRAIYIFTYGARFVQIMLISSNLRRNAIDNYYSGLIESLHYRLERFAFRSKLTWVGAGWARFGRISNICRHRYWCDFCRYVLVSII